MSRLRRFSRLGRHRPQLGVTSGARGRGLIGVASLFSQGFLRYLLVPIGVFGDIELIKDVGPPASDAGDALDSPVAVLLKVLGTGVAGQILAALAPGPLRTRSLTDRISECAPRTVYRHAGRLAEQGLIVREEEGGVPSVVTYRLSEGGRELFRLLDAHASHALCRTPAGTEDGWWTSLALLGEMWSSGWVAELSSESRSPTELSEMTPGMSFHQVNRRVHLLRARSLLCERAHPGRGKRYELAENARQKMALIAGIGRWRERHGVARKQCGLTGPEAATVLRVALPLTNLREYAGARIKLGVVGARDAGGGRGSKVLLVEVGRDGSPRCGDAVDSPADAWAAGTVDLWLSALIDGDRSRMRAGGDVAAFEACLTGLRAVLWNGDENAVAA
jgi:DNA-binding HxlR family transcriptional regulator